MTPQTSRLQRWLRGDPEDGRAEETPESQDPAPTGHPGRVALTPLPALPALPALPERRPDALRPKVQGLRVDALDVRRRQVSAQEVVPTLPAPVVPEGLVSLRGALEQELDSLRVHLEGFASALVTTRDGGLLAAVGLTAERAATLARATSVLPVSLGVPEESFDTLSLTLASGDVVVCTDCGSAQVPALLRVTLRGTALGIALHQAQQVARRISAVLRDAD